MKNIEEKKRIQNFGGWGLHKILKNGEKKIVFLQCFITWNQMTSILPFAFIECQRYSAFVACINLCMFDIKGCLSVTVLLYDVWGEG